MGRTRQPCAVTDDDGSTDVATLPVVVNDLGPTAALVGDTVLDEGQAGSFGASASTSSPDTIVSYEWDWNYNGITFNPSGDTGATRTHAWSDNGSYTVAVQVTDDDGSTGLAALTVTVRDTTAPVVTVNSLTTTDGSPELTGTVDDPDAAVRVTIANQAYDAANHGNGTWTLADNTISPPLEGGTYDVTVTATDAVGNVGTYIGTGALIIQTAPVQRAVDTW